MMLSLRAIGTREEGGARRSSLRREESIYDAAMRYMARRTNSLRGEEYGADHHTDLGGQGHTTPRH